MLKSILNFDGVEQLNKNTQKQINGGNGWSTPHAICAQNCAGICNVDGVCYTMEK